MKGDIGVTIVPSQIQVIGEQKDYLQVSMINGHYFEIHAVTQDNLCKAYYEIAFHMNSNLNEAISLEDCWMLL